MWPMGLTFSYESVYVRLFNSEHPECEPCENRKPLRFIKTLNRHITVSSFKKNVKFEELKIYFIIPTINITLPVNPFTTFCGHDARHALQVSLIIF